MMLTAQGESISGFAGRSRYDLAMDLPPGFTVTLPGGVIVATCDRCRQARGARRGITSR
jgi:hypothetical protein